MLLALTSRRTQEGADQLRTLFVNTHVPLPVDPIAVEARLKEMRLTPGQMQWFEGMFGDSPFMHGVVMTNEEKERLREMWKMVRDVIVEAGRAWRHWRGDAELPLSSNQKRWVDDLLKDSAEAIVLRIDRRT